jgi:RecA-family ATPase
VIVDPARSFLDGNEDQSETVSRFLDALRRFAERTGAAVVVLHHLAKIARPRSLDEVRDAVRGSGVWLDRPRVGIGMYLSGGRTMVGLIK